MLPLTVMSSFTSAPPEMTSPGDEPWPKVTPRLPMPVTSASADPARPKVAGVEPLAAVYVNSSPVVVNETEPTVMLLWTVMSRLTRLPPAMDSPGVATPVELLVCPKVTSRLPIFVTSRLAAPLRLYEFDEAA